jgi:Tfp pilus assembly protein PilO
MRVLTRREKLLTTAVAIAVVITLVQWVVLKPQKRKLQQAKAELATTNQQLTDMYTKLASIKGLREEVANKEIQLTALKESLSFQGELAQVLNQLTQEARHQGIYLQYLQPGETEILTNKGGKAGDFRRSVIEFGIRCRYQELGEFLQALATQPFFLDVAAIQVDREQTAEPALLNVELSVAIVIRG